MGNYRIIIADDHVIFRQGMKRLIDEMEGVEVAGEANNGKELMRLLEQTQTDMVLLDISMPELRGIEATLEIKKKYPNVAVLILTMHKDKAYLHHAIASGAGGYLLKEDSDLELIHAIHRIQEGEIYISRLMSTELGQDAELLGKGGLSPPNEPLSLREKEILKLIVEGRANRQIADLLFISPRTVETHRANIMRKLNLKKTAELVKYAMVHGF